VTSVLHLIDDDCNETCMQALETLRARTAAETIAHVIATIDARAGRLARGFIQVPVHPTLRYAPSRFVNFSPALAELSRDSRTEIIHAWGIQAAVVASATRPEVPLLLSLIDPSPTAEVARWIRSFPVGVNVAAGSQLIANRLMAAGISPDRVAVIRGAADFAAINAARRTDLRSRLVGDAQPVVLLSGPASREGGQEVGIWAAAIVKYLHRGLRVLMPYSSREADRLQRWSTTLPHPGMVIVPDRRMNWAELVACSDVFLQPARDEVCVEPLAVAMAGGLPIVATAVRSIAEMIADRQNGFLVRKAEPKLVAARLLTALEDLQTARQVAETARGQAFEVFGVRAFADNYRRVYENLSAQRPISDGVRDTAMVA